MQIENGMQRSLERLLTQRQVDWRVPGLAAGVIRDGILAWSGGAGAADVTQPSISPDSDTQYRIGSITKTFTAALVMALRDEGRLELDDRLTRFLPQTRHASLTIRQMLSHASGLQREPVGDIWESLTCPDLEQLLAGLEQAQRVLPPQHRWHYSNLAYAVLGEVVSRLDDRSWEDSLRERILEPLGMKRTGLRPAPPLAVGYFPDPFTDQVHIEPDLEPLATAPCGGLWSTLEDLAGWAAFLAEPDEAVLRTSTVDEMCQPQIMADLDSWTRAWGLGTEMIRRGDHVFVGHTGGMPGHTTGLFVHRRHRVGAVVLANSTSGVDPAELATDLAIAVLEGDPVPSQPWRPGQGAPSELVGVPGHWWSEGSLFVFRVTGGRLEARPDPGRPGSAPAVFVRIENDLYRTESGREEGELLRLVRDGTGAVVKMYWATYPFTRAPETFGGNG